MRKQDIKVGETYSVFGLHPELSCEAKVIKATGKGWWSVKLASGELANVPSRALALSLEKAMAKNEAKPKKEEKAKGPQKTCPKCGKGNHARRKVCEHCKVEFPTAIKAAPAHMNLGDIAKQTKPPKKDAPPPMIEDCESAHIMAALTFVQDVGGFEEADKLIWVLKHAVRE